MSPQLGLFDRPLPPRSHPAGGVPRPDAEAEARDDAMRRAEEGAGENWCAAARAACLEVLERGVDFTADDVWDTGLPKPRNARALGPVLNALAREGRIVATGRFTRSRQEGCHKMPRRIWRANTAPA